MSSERTLESDGGAPESAGDASEEPVDGGMTGQQSVDPAHMPAVERARQYAAENKYAYGPKYAGRELDWQVLGTEERAEDIVRVSLSYQPTGNFKGRPGSEWIEVNSDLRVTARSQIAQPFEPKPWLLIGGATAAVLAALVLVPVLLFAGGDSGDPLYVAGRVLWMRVSEPQVMPAVHYTGLTVEGEMQNFGISPIEEGNSLAVVQVRLINNTADSVRIIVDENAAEIRTANNQSFSPINSVERSVGREAVTSASVYPGFIPLWHSFVLGAREEIVGMMVFEVPADATIREFRWEATDSMIVRYPNR